MKSIRTKIMAIIGGLIVLAMIASAVLVINITKTTVTDYESNTISISTEKIVTNVNAYLQKYVTVAQQLTNDSYVRDMIEAGTTFEEIKESPYYEKIRATLAGTVASDPENIMTANVVNAATNLAFNNDTWIAGPDTFNLKEKRYGFTDSADLANGFVVTEPYEDVVTGKMVVTIAAPIMEGSKFIGTICLDVQITTLNEMVTNTNSTYKTGYQTLVSDKDVVITHKNADNVLKPVGEIGFDANMVSNIEASNTNVVRFSDNGVDSFGILGTTKYTGWKVLSIVPAKEYLETIGTVSQRIGMLYAICMLILIVAMVTISKGIVAPLKKLTKVTNELAKGNLDATIDVRSKDEVGQLANSMRDLTDRLKTYIDYIEEVSKALDDFGKGKLTIELNHAYDGDFAKLKEALLKTSSIFKQTIGEIVEIAEHVSCGSDQVASGAQMLAQGTTEQAASIEELSSTIQEISDHVNKNAENARNAAQQVQSVGDAADQSNAQMKNMIAAIDEINVKSSEIGKIIKTIDDIAFQTNILALNAAVEAARAGAAGKGFAVVADEVRNLAQKSAEAAKSTTELIEDSLSSVQNGTVIASDTERILSKVLEGVNQTVGLINDISEASSEQAKVLSQTLIGVEQINSVVQTNSATAEESSAASEELAGQSTLLKKVSSKFTL